MTMVRLRIVFRPRYSMPNTAYLFRGQIRKFVLDGVCPIVTKVNGRLTQYMDHEFFVHVVRPGDPFL
jgi:hypothetical protein